MAEKSSKATLVSYLAWPTVAIVKAGGKNLRVNIPANSVHPAVGEEFDLKDKWNKRELAKDEVAELTAPEKKEDKK